MDKQLIIAVSREYGSGGHEIARRLAKKFNISFYDRNMLDEIAEEKGVNVENLKKYDELPKIPVISRNVKGFSNSPEEAIANIQFDYLKAKAESGESFVIVGRCAEHILKDFDGLVKIFILGDHEIKLMRVQEYRNVPAEKAESIIQRHDRKRKAYHNYYCPVKWGDSRGYDITINSSTLGIDKTVDVLQKFVENTL